MSLTQTAVNPGGGGGGLGAAPMLMCYSLGVSPDVFQEGYVVDTFNDIGALVARIFYDDEGAVLPLANIDEFRLGGCCACNGNEAGPVPRFDILTAGQSWTLHDKVISFSATIINNDDTINVSDGVTGNQALIGSEYNGFNLGYGVESCRQFLREEGAGFTISVVGAASQVAVSWTECDAGGGGGE